ncbi:MAG: hypothetical protein JWO89_2836, partial [Verrucomicrobiaceae bacterium]|nr:hypothetical protein [Verrucomicrobiaceae bacterium]
MSQAHPTDDLRIERIRSITSPTALMQEWPVGESEAVLVEQSRRV